MKNKLAYLFGSMISNFGDGIQQIAIMWYTYHLTGEALSIGIMIAIYYLPSILLTPLVAVYVDHHQSKNIVISIDIMRFLIVLGIAVLIFLNLESIILIYLLQFLLAVCYTIYKPAEQAFIKESFLNQEIPFVLSKSATLNEIAQIGGSAVSGVFLIKLSIAASFFINSLTFLFAAVLFMLIIKVNKKQGIAAKINYRTELASGWKYINRRQGMKYLLFLSILNSISIQMTTTLLLPLSNSFKGGSTLYSFFDISFAFGGIIAGMVVTFFLKKYKQQAIIFTMTGMEFTSLLLYLNRIEIVAAILIFMFGLFTMSHLVLTQTLIQLNSAKEYIARVIGIRSILASFVKISSALSTGFFISKLGVPNIFLVFSLIILACFFTLKWLRNVYVPKL